MAMGTPITCQSLTPAVFTFHLLRRCTRTHRISTPLMLDWLAYDPQMEGMEDVTSEDSDVTGMGQAAEVIKCIRGTCPDVLPMAPLLEDVMFAGFKETRFRRFPVRSIKLTVLLCKLPPCSWRSLLHQHRRGGRTGTHRAHYHRPQ